MANHTTHTPQRSQHIYPLITPRERLSIWEEVRGLWKNKKGIEKELKKLRKEWDRKLPNIR